MTIAADLASYAVSTSWEQLPDDGRQALKGLVLDSIGCALGAIGRGGPVAAVRTVVDDLGGNPHSTLIGGGRTAPDLAALANGAAVRYLDFNDTFVSPGESCHPSDNLSAVLAAAEFARASGREFLTALATAYQVQCRLSEVAPVRDRGFDHTTQGAFAVAAGAARALSMDPGTATHAIAIAGTPSQALRVTRTGALSQWKGLAYPMAAATALRGVFLARAGVTGPGEVFEGHKGFMESVSGPFELDWRHEGLDIIPRVLVKRYNAEAHAQSVIEGLLALRASPGFDVADVDRVHLAVFAACFQIIGGGSGGDRHHVDSRESADHSLPYLAAVALLDGEVTPTQYAPSRIEADDVQALLRRVHVQEDPALTARVPAEMPVRIRIELSDGSVLTRDQADFAGYPTRPMRWDELCEKFGSLTADVGPASVLGDLVDVIADLESVDDIADLTTLLAQACPMAPVTRGTS